MPRLPFFLRPPPRPTVPNAWTEIHSQITDYTTINLPTTGSASFSQTFTLPFRIRAGHIIMAIFHYDTIGFSYDTRRWNGFWTRKIFDTVNPPPIGYNASDNINIGMGGVEGMTDTIYISNVFSINNVDLEMSFSFSEREGSAPYPVRIRWGIRIFKPTSFITWEEEP